MNPLNRFFLFLAFLYCGSVTCAAADTLPVLRSFQLPFVATDIAFDPVRPFLYATDHGGKKLARVNLTNGAVVKQYEFDYPPERMAVTPDGTRLFVALLTRPHSYSWLDDEGHIGHIAEIELGTGNLLQQFQINEDPYDLVATDNGLLVVTGGSGQGTKIRSYRVSTGENVGTADIYQRGRITLHPSQTAVYTADTALGPADVYRYNLDPETGALVVSNDSPYHGDYPVGGDVFAHRNGQSVIARSGAVFTCSTNPAQDLIYTRSLVHGPINDIAFDLPRRAFFVSAKREVTYYGSRSWLDYYNFDSTEVARSYPLPEKAHFVSAKAKALYTVSLTPTATVIREYRNPAIGGETNTPPVASFTWFPTNATTLTRIVFDASSCTDTFDQPSGLRYRWDWDNDGIFDTPFTGHPLATNRFNIAGTKTVTLQVKDSFGAVSQARRKIQVALQADPGTAGGSNVPFVLGFAAEHIVFDRMRPRVYATDADGQRLIVMNLTNGLVERQFALDSKPGRMGMTPNGRWLYVALSPGGYIAEFDLRTRVKTREFAINRNVFDLVATDTGTLVITTKDSPASIHSYDISSGTELSSFSSVNESTRISLHPSQGAIYFSDWSSDFEKLEIGADGILDGHMSFYRPDYNSEQGKIVFLNETNLVSTGGGVYSIDYPGRTNLQSIGSLETGASYDTYFDSARGALFRLKPHSWDSPAQITAHNPRSLRAFWTNDVPEDALYLGGHRDQVYVATVGWQGTRLYNYYTPAQGLQTNSSPVASFTLSSTNISTLSRVSFNASASLDDGGLDNLCFRWDWNNDGVFDTPFTNNPVQTKRFNVAGPKTVALEVRDRYGAIHGTTGSFHVALESDPGVTGITNAPYELPFSAADVVFIPGTHFLYAADLAGKRLVKVNLVDGHIERQFDFESHPRQMTLTADGRWMYVALAARPYSDSGTRDAEHFIAEFDLQTGLKTRELSIRHDPFDIAATDEGLLFVSGAGYRGALACYQLSTGQRLSTNLISEGTLLAVHPSQKAVYLTAWGAVHKLEIQTNQTLIPTRYSPAGPRLNEARILFPFDTTAITTSGGRYSVSAARTNFTFVSLLAGGEFYDAARDEANGAFVTAGGLRGSGEPNRTWTTYDLATWQPIYSADVTTPLRYVGVTGDSLWLVSVATTTSTIDRVPNPAVGHATNTAPVADFTWSPLAPSTFSETTFDGSLSSDNLDRANDLLYRWDWNSDGIFDTEFVRQTNATVTFKTFGPRYVTLEVKDRLGLTNRITKWLDVTSVPDPGVSYTQTNTPYVLPFVPFETVFDPNGPFFYASHAAGRKVVRFNLTNGLIDRVFRFEQMPQHLAITPNGARLYAGAMDDSVSNWNLHPGPCTVAEFDLKTGKRLQEFSMRQKSFALAASDNGFFAVLGYSDGTCRFRTYSRTNGALLDDLWTVAQTQIAFDPFQNVFYGSAKKVFVEAATGRITSSEYSPFWGTTYIAPDGVHVFDDGDAYRKVNGQEILIGHVDRGRLQFDTNHVSFFAVSPDKIQWYNSTSLEWVHETDPWDDIEFAGTWRNHVYMGVSKNGRTTITRMPHPMLGAEKNNVPVPAFKWSPRPVLTGSTVEFDARLTTDDTDPVSALEYRWDLDGDGSFEMPMGNQPFLHRTFRLAGTYRIGLQVKDRFGAVASVYKDVIIRSASEIRDQDMIWRHSDGRLAVWHMDGGVRVRASHFAHTMTAGWDIAGVADFNGDGYRDILWSFSGRLMKLWCLNGAVLLKSVPLRLNLPNAWYLVGVKDFNADKHSDLLLQNTSGSLAVWFMDRTNFVSSVSLRSGVPVATGWKIAGIGDLDGDSEQEIVWRRSDARLAAWFMSSTNIVSSHLLTGPVMGVDWQVSGVADYNNDKRADILWRNSRTAETVVWVMNGERYEGNLSISQADAGWKDWRLLRSP